MVLAQGVVLGQALCMVARALPGLLLNVHCAACADLYFERIRQAWLSAWHEQDGCVFAALTVKTTRRPCGGTMDNPGGFRWTFGLS